MSSQRRTKQKIHTTALCRLQDTADNWPVQLVRLLSMQFAHSQPRASKDDRAMCSVMAMAAAARRHAAINRHMAQLASIEASS